MEEKKIYNFQLKEIQNVLRLTWNIYRHDAPDETAYDRMLKKSTAFVENALSGNPDQFVSAFDKYRSPSKEAQRSRMIEAFEGRVVGLYSVENKAHNKQALLKMITSRQDKIDEQEKIIEDLLKENVKLKKTQNHD